MHAALGGLEEATMSDPHRVEGRPSPRLRLAVSPVFGPFRQHALLPLCLLFAVRVVSAEPCDFGVEADLKIAGGFVWRGTVVSDEPVAQPSATVRYGDFSMNAWATRDLGEREEAAEYGRVDVTADYSMTAGRHLFGAGLVGIAYYEGGADDTMEAFLWYALDVTLLPAITVAYDFRDIQGFYASLGLAQSVELIRDRLALDLHLEVNGADEAYADALFGYSEQLARELQAFAPDGPSLVDLTFSVETPLRLGEVATVTPGVQLMTLLDSDIRDAVDDRGGDIEQAVFSVTLGLRL